VSTPPAQQELASVRAILRVVMTVVASVLALYVVYLLRTPISWMLIAVFVAVATSGPVNLLSRRVPRGAAIAIVYIGIVLPPVAIGAVLIPPAVEQGVKLAKNLPDYVDDLNRTFQDNEQLNELNDKYDLTQKLDDTANDLISDLGSAPSERIATAVASYVGGALAQATIAGAAAFLMLVILGVPSPLPLAVIILLLDLIPLVGATLGAIVVGVTAFVDFPTTTIIWTIFAIVYQQFENYVSQPRLQSRAVKLDPSAIQIAIREYMDYRRAYGPGTAG
jgi:predicted PurR-regulated permease PerM